MSVFKQVEIDTQPAKEAGARIGGEVAHAIRNGIKGAKLGDVIANEFSKGAHEGVIGIRDVERLLDSAIKVHNKALGFSSTSAASEIQHWGRRRIVAEASGSDKQIANYMKDAFGRMSSLQGSLTGELYSESLEGAKSQLHRQINAIEKRAATMFRAKGMSPLDVELHSRRVGDLFRQRVDKLGEYYTGGTYEGMLNVPATQTQIANLQRVMESTYESMGQRTQAAREASAKEKQRLKDLREEKRLIEQIARQYDRYLKMQGYDALSRAPMVDSKRTALNMWGYGQFAGNHPKIMDALNIEMASQKQQIEMFQDSIKQAKMIESWQKKAQSALNTMLTDYGHWLKAAGHNKEYIYTRQQQLKSTYDISSIVSPGGLDSFLSTLSDKRRDLMSKEVWEKEIGFTGTRASLQERLPGVLSRAKRAESLISGDTTKANQIYDNNKRLFQHALRVVSPNGAITLQQIERAMDALDKDSQAKLQAAAEQKKTTRALREYRHATENEVDDLIRRGRDRQRLKNMWEGLPLRNMRYASTPFLPISVLRHIPGIGRVGWGRPLDTERDDIIRQIREAKNKDEIDAIRKRYEFDRRREVYDKDLGRFRNNRGFLPWRSAEGEYMPTLGRFGEAFMRTTNKLATAWIAVMWARMAMQSIGAPISAAMSAADAHTRQKNMYNVSLPYGMTAGKTFEQWEDESFGKARALRMKASDYREMVMNAAPIFHTAVYGKDYNKGAIGADGKMHYQGERIVTNMGQVETIAENLHRMAKISGSSDVEMQAALRQVIQMVSKGRGNIQDIRPILESGGHMGDMIARFGFGVSGAADLYKLNEEKELTADRLMKNLLSDKTSDDLRELMRRSARTWEEVAAIMKGDLNKLMMPTIRSLASESEYGIGDKLTSMTKTLADQEWLGRAIRDKIDEVIETIQKNWYVYMSQFLRFAGTMILMSTVAVRALGILNQIVNRGTQLGLSMFGYSHLDEVVSNTIKDAPRPVWQTMGTFLDNEVFGDSELGLHGHEGVRKYLASKGVDTSVLTGMHGKFVTQSYAKESIAGIKALSELQNLSDSELENILGKGGRKYVKRASKLMENSSFVEDMEGLAGGLHSIDETNKQIDAIMEGHTALGKSLLALGSGDNLKKLVSDMEANVKKEEDARFPGHALDLDKQTAGNTGETAKNTRKANQIQLAILKQIAGTRVINRVVHVNPNIVSNVGTIRNGIEYDQLLKDLGSTVNHAVTAYAL